MRKLNLISLGLIFFVNTLFAGNIERLFYVTPFNAQGSFNTEQLQQIKNHSNAIDIIAPQIYSLNETGDINGVIDPGLLSVVKESHLKMMPLVTNIINDSFDQEQFHRFLHDTVAQNKAINKLLLLCQENQFYGIQFDFESINIKDKTEFTRFYQQTANKLHQNGFTLSIAVVPRLLDTKQDKFSQWYNDNWTGAYDYNSIAQVSDFISIMSYDQHSSLTTPGPVAAYDWVESTIRDLLKDVSPDKISLGIPVYSGYFVTGVYDNGSLPEKFTFRSIRTTLRYSAVQALIDKLKLSLQWHEKWQINYAIFNNQRTAEYLFVEDVNSFQAKINLVEKYHLRGFSVWKLGLEDPKIWQ